MLRHRCLWLAAVLVSTAILGAYMANLPLVTTLRDLLPASTPGMDLYEEARTRFGGDETAYIGIEADDHFTEEGLARIRRATELIEAHPFVERVLSPVNAQQMWLDEEETLIIDNFVREGVSAEQVKTAMLSDPFVEGALLSEDGRFVLIVAQAVASTNVVGKQPKIATEVAKRTAAMPKTLGHGENGPRRLLEVAKQPLGAELFGLALRAGYRREQVHAVGFTPLLSALFQEAEKNLQVLFPLTLLMMMVTLVLLFRRPLDVVLPFLCVGPAIIWAIALGGLVFGRITLMSTVTPVMVMVVGVSDVVHLVTQYRHELARGHDRDEAIRLSFRHVGAACTLTSITTLIGFGSMIFLPLPTSQELGVTAGMGVVAAFVLSFILTPILLSFTRPKPVVEQRSGWIAELLVRLAAFIRPRPLTVTIVGLLVTAATIGLLLQRRVENSLSRKLEPNHPMRVSVQTVERALGASGEVELLIDTGQPDGLKDPAVIRAMAELANKIEGIKEISEVVSVVDLLSRMHELLAPDLAAKDPVPATSRQQVAQYLLLFELSGGKQLHTLVDPRFQHARMVLRGEEGTAEAALEHAAMYDRWAAELLPQGVTGVCNGIGLMAAHLGPAIFWSTLKGFLMALGLIAIMMAILFRSVKVGLLSLIPNLFPVAAGMSVIPFVFEQIDVDTLAFVPICVGIAVDDTIHFLARFRLEREKGLPIEEAVSATIREAGHGIIRTTVVLVAGYALLLMADYQPIGTVGLLLPVTLMTAVIMDLTMVPAMAQLGWLDVKSRRA